VKGPFFLAQAAAPWLRRSNGAIVNFADTGGILGWRGTSRIRFPKAGMIMLTKTLAKALAPEVRVKCDCAGDDYDAGRSARVGAGIVKLAPLKKRGRRRMWRRPSRIWRARNF